CDNNSDTSNVVTVAYFNPQVLTTAGATRCGTGTLTLGATASAGAGLKWYTTPTGGAPVGTGTSFTTPVINSTTTYYVSANNGGGVESVGKPSPTTTTSTTGSLWGLVFDVVNAPIVLSSVDIYSVGTVAGNMSVELRDNTGAVLLTAGPFTYPPGTTANPTQVTLPLNFNIPIGTGYRLVSASMSGGSVIRETSGNTYPYTSPSGNVVISSGFIGSPGSASYYWFYNWQVSTGCESPRQSVTATVSGASAFEITADKTVCNDAITPLTVTSNVADYNEYLWTPVAGLFADAAATIPYTGSSAATVYFKSSTPGSVLYTATANNTSNSCSNIDSVRLNVLPASLTVEATMPELCISGTTTLSVPSAGLQGATLQWFASSDGITYTPVTGATNNNYTTATLTDTTYFRLEIRNGAGVVCLQPSRTIPVNNPALLTNTPATRCGPGTVTLNATASGSSTVRWYESATGGAPIFTGNSFTTPIINNTTTYYAAAGAGTSVQSLGAPGVTSFPNAGTFASFTAGELFTVMSGTTISSVDIFPTAAIGTNFQIVIRSGTATGAVVATYQGTTTVTGTVANPVVQTVPVNFTLTPGTYAMTFFNGALQAPLTGNGIYPGALRNNPATGVTYPYTIPGVISITNGSLNNAWYYFYNWQIGSGCESPRQAVTATVTTAPAFDVTNNTTICNNAIQALSVTSATADFN
ncbi:MAG: hypothetical protein H0U44_06240, partial [Flavisolibacter sp.]|nr:hypothetical protein [Flavisolibacter sp.]